MLQCSISAAGNIITQALKPGEYPCATTRAAGPGQTAVVRVSITSIASAADRAKMRTVETSMTTSMSGWAGACPDYILWVTLA